MKIFILIISVVLLLTSTAFADTDAEQLRKEILYPVLRLNVLDSNSPGLAYGTAIVIYSGRYRLPGTEKSKIYTYAITDYHVVTRGRVRGKKSLQKTDLNTSIIIADTKIQKTGHGGEHSGRRVARVVARDKGHDLALLVLLGHKEKYPYVAKLQGVDDTFGTFDSVWSVGSALGFSPFPRRGIIAIPNIMHHGRSRILTDIHVNSGDSGGGIFRFYQNCGCFKLIGVTQAMPKYTYLETRLTADGVRGEIVRLPDTHLNFSIPAKIVRTFLKSNGFGFILKEGDKPAEK